MNAWAYNIYVYVCIECVYESLAGTCPPVEPSAEGRAPEEPWQRHVHRRRQRRANRRKARVMGEPSETTGPSEEPPTVACMSGENDGVGRLAESLPGIRRPHRNVAHPRNQ